MNNYPREETRIGDFGKLECGTERYCPDIFAKVWHHNGIVKTIRKENGEEILGVSFYNYPNQIIDVPSKYFANFTKKYGTEPCKPMDENHDSEIMRIVKKAEAEFYASV